MTKNSDGNYLVSVRHADTLALVSGEDGHIIWRCGGRNSDFTIEDDALFSRQHHIRYLEHSNTRSIVTLMDNAIGNMELDTQPATHNSSRGLMLELNHKPDEPFTARKVKQYLRPDGGYNDRRGSMQILPNGNVFMAWTDAGYLSEHSDSDEVLMEARWLNDDRFGTYRGYKYNNWIGMPNTLPDVKAIGYQGEGGMNDVVLYASWNGATEVRQWKFLSNGRPIGVVPRRGFETVFTAANVTGHVSVQALDVDDRELGLSEEVVVEWRGGSTVAQHFDETDSSTNARPREGILTRPLVVGVMAVLSFIGCVAIFWFVFLLVLDMRRRFPWHKAEATYKEIPMEER